MLKKFYTSLEFSEAVQSVNWNISFTYIINNLEAAWLVLNELMWTNAYII